MKTYALLINASDGETPTTAISGWRAAEVSDEEKAQLIATIQRGEFLLLESEEEGDEDEHTPIEEGLSLTQIGSADAASAPAEEDAPLAGWQHALSALGGTIDDTTWPARPEGLERLAPVANVLDSAGQTATVRLSDGCAFAAYGFPDLRRPSSKVLLVRTGDPHPEILALHRLPRQAGTVVYDNGTPLPDATRSPRQITETVTGRPYPNMGQLFAVDGSVVYILRDQRVFSWDGNRERDEGRASQTLASLVLRWSQR